MNKIDLSFSVVTFHTPAVVLKPLLASFSKVELPHSLTFVNNGFTDFPSETQSFKIIQNQKNVGFGTAHNQVLKENLGKAKYHVVLNPDVEFERGTFEKIVKFLDENPQVGLCSPKIIYPDGSTQFLCKKIPTPFDLFARRFLPFFLQKLFTKRLDEYEFRNFDYDTILEIPVLSGCCMILRDEILQQVQGFDERFFLYMEDVDLCRRFYEKGQNIHYPNAQIVHHYQKSSYRFNKSFKYHLQSAFRYFSKWGWWHDPARRA